MTLILVRHGQTAVNAGGRLQGRIDAPLTDLGREQAQATAAAVAAAIPDVDRVVASPLRRAQQTAAAFGRPVETDDRWIELDYGDWDGHVLGSMPAEEWERWRRDPHFAPPGGESLVELAARVAAACAELAEEARHHDVVVVSHVSPIKAAVAWALGVGPETSWRMFLGVAAVTRIGVGPKGPSLLSYNEVGHLAAVASSS
jgi:broad specificity phosphatase PhoE